MQGSESERDRDADTKWRKIIRIRFARFIKRHREGGKYNSNNNIKNE